MHLGQRKKSAPALLAKIQPPELPPRFRGQKTGREQTSYSHEDLCDTYATVDEVSSSKKVKGHRRNRSAGPASPEDLGLVIQDKSRENISKLKKKDFKRSHKGMKSHETIETVFNQSQSYDKDSGAVDSGALGSGKSSVESSSGESASASKESQNSYGK